MDYQKEIEFAKSMAVDAGKIMKKYYRIDQGVEIKEDSTPVTLADIEINNLLIERVKNEFSDCGVLGEEESWNESREKLWVCDPIDGTPAFIYHIPTFMFSLALVVDGEPVLGIAFNATTGDTYHAMRGYGSFLNDKAINTSSREWGNEARLAGSSDGAVDGLSVSVLKEQGIKVINSFGAVFKGCLIAEGSLDGRVFVHNGAHDIAAVKLIIEEAGGKVTDIDGNEQRYDRKLNGALMSNGLIHDKLLEVAKEMK
ncbi:hypothetical protein A3F64_00515 [Candidatus Saccharibacteria bacterium RIFCSPHIGHO2_12_FULL_42_8]|nr:MAG: hypothetical protein A3F64_00515 [Candidatus Saccharibacteria bacterium RIFCSPHIGHO2_12_FULL_42_8]